MSTKPSDIQELAKLAELAQSLLNGKEYLIGSVADRFTKAANKYPHDQTIRAMQNVFERRIAKEGSLTIVSQQDIQSLYDEVSNLGNNVKFEEELGDLLLENRRHSNATYNDKYIRSIRDSGTSMDLADSETVAELGNLFAGPGDKLAQSKFVENGRKGVVMELSSMGFANPSVEIANRDNNFVIYAAEVDTRHGRIPFLIPAEIKLGSVLLPSVFVSGNEFLELNAENVHIHINKVIGSNIKLATPTTVLSTLNKLVGTVELTKQASDNGFADVMPESPGYYRDVIEEAPHELMGLQADKVEMPQDLRGLSESMIRETLLEAGLSYNRDLVIAAKNMLATELRSCGLHYERVAVSSEYPGGIILAVNIVGKGGKKGIEVPIEIASNQILMPTTFVSGASAKNFDALTLRTFADEQEGEFNPTLSDKYDMSFKDLYSTALTSAAHGNFVDVEESLAVIAEKFGPEFHKVAFADLMQLVDIGFNQPVDKPLDEVERYIQAAAENIRHKEADIKMSKNLIYLYPED